MACAIRFNGGCAVITGAAGGVGGGLACKAAALGMRVVLADLDAAQLDRLAATLSTEALVVPTDVADPAALEALADSAYERFGRVDLLFNNAGVMSTGMTWEITPANFQRSLAINVLGIHNGIRAFVPRMLKAGTPAHIVNTGSPGGFLPSAMMSPYSASKAAAVALTECLYAEMNMLKAPIGVSLLDPGTVRSGIFSAPIGDDGRNPMVQKFVEFMRDHGAGERSISPEQSAENTFAGIQAGKFWILPDPEILDEALRQRVDSILARRNPEVYVGDMSQ